MQLDGVLAPGSLTAGFGIRFCVNTIRVQGATEDLAILLHLFAQRALQNAQPVAVGQHFVLRVHCGHRIFQVENGRQCRFDHQITHMGRVGFANGVGLVDLQVQMQTVVHEQQ